MGDVADDVLNGLLCELCGVWMEDCFDENGIVHETFDNPPGYPRQCEDCKEGQC